jgi:hypothetical protein
MLLEAASLLDAHHVKVGNIPGHQVPLAQLTERFGELCDIAAERTAAKIVYEFMPFDTNVRSLDSVLEVVGGAARPNGGIAIDTGTCRSSASRPTSSVSSTQYMSWIELSDGQFAGMDIQSARSSTTATCPAGRVDIRGYMSPQGHATPGLGASGILPKSLQPTD